MFFLSFKYWKRNYGYNRGYKTAFIDPTDKEKKFVAVQVKFKKTLNKPVSLENIKKNPIDKGYNSFHVW